MNWQKKFKEHNLAKELNFKILEKYKETPEQLSFKKDLLICLIQ